MSHGVRRTYQITGCRCPHCSAANTAYSASYRQAIRGGRRPLGAHVAGLDVARAIAALVDDGHTRAAIARALGHQTPRLQYRGGVTLRTALRIRRLHQDWTE